MFSFKKTLRLLGGAAALLTTISIVPRPAEAAPPRVWMPLQGVGPEWKPGMLQPLVDARIELSEYANGIQVDLNDFSNSTANGDGRLYLSIADNAGFTATQCLKPNGTGCEGSTLFLGLQVHALTPALGSETGSVTIYLDASRQQSLDFQSCSDSNGPNTKPAADDRKIVIDYTSPAGQAALNLTIREYAGNCLGWQEITPPALDPQGKAWNYKASARETLGAGRVPNALNFEVSVNVQPRNATLFTSQILYDHLFGLGVLHSPHTPWLYSSFGHFPSIYNKPPTDLDTWSWETVDLATPKRIDLGMTAYNVGQLQIVSDGGQGEAEDFARLTYRNDVICMVEQMVGSERDEVVERINTLREAEGLGRMNPVYVADGEAPNNMILASGPIIASDSVLYSDLPEVSAKCGEEFNFGPSGGECLGDGAGYKGIVWARIGVKKSKAIRGGKPETWDGDEFIDVFCTHTQADYENDGEFARTQWCYDTVGTAAVGKYCVKGDFGPLDNPWQANLREEQWRALKNWSRAKRAGGNGRANGLDRPAFVLGDLNQIGPKGVSGTTPNQDVEGWMTATSNKGGFGTEYRAMREMLGTWPLSTFDQANGWAWDLYDLLARDRRGTWIGNGTESAIPGTSASSCITVGQFTGYDTVAKLPREARLDYILVLPAEGTFPYYSLTGPTSHSAEPEIDISANAGSWVDGLGCASDHAQVSTRIGLVQTGVKASYNPKKSHRVTYRVSYLWDFNHADGGATDWMVELGDFEMQHLSSSNFLLESKTKSFTDDETPDGYAVGVDWYDFYVANGEEKIRMGVYVTDSDQGPSDVYDGSSFAPGFLGPHFEFDHKYPGIFRFLGDFGTVGGTLLGTADPSSADPDGSCTHGCIGILTQGDGEGVAPDEDVRIIQNIEIEEIN